MAGVRVARASACLVAMASVALVGCTTVKDGRPVGAPQPSTSSSTSAQPGPSACPSSYVSPDPKRPNVRLQFTFDDSLTHVSGSEHIEFTPDMPIHELVFRLTANTEPTVDQGNSITVTSAKADHGAGTATYTTANADGSTQGGLLHIPFPSEIAAGTTVTADLTFRLTLGTDSFDRFGRIVNDGRAFAWIGSAQPLLAWERGFGWHTEDMIDFTAESATSEAMRTELTVTAPAADTVIMSGDAADPPKSGVTRTWTSTIDAARDVSVAVGPFSVSDTTVDGVKLRVGGYTSSERDQLVPEFTRALRELTKLYGPFPFPSLSVARLPNDGGGIEYPSSILMFDSSRLVAVHETAHQWFYAMVGDSQSLHPWLDEAFAQYSEERINGRPEDPNALKARGAVDSSVQSYGQRGGDYYFTTYNKGAAALEAAREAAGGDSFDDALRCYVNANAWRIANPVDLNNALAKLPKAVAVLREAGALR